MCFNRWKMIRNYNRGSGGSDVDLSPIYSQLNTINNWILHADFDTNLSYSIVSLSNEFNDFTNNFDTYLDSYLDTYLDSYLDISLSNLTNSITKNSYNISVLKDNTNNLQTSFNDLYANATNMVTSYYSADINSIKSSVDSIISLTQTLSSAVINISNEQNNHNSSITNLNSSVQYLMDNFNTDVQPQLFHTQYTDTIFSEPYVCFYNPYSATFFVNDLKYNLSGQQAISMNCAAISSVNSVSFYAFQLYLTCNYDGYATFNSAAIWDVDIKGNQLNSSYLLDLEFNSCSLGNANFNSLTHLNISECSFQKLELNDISRCELINNPNGFFRINANNIWQFIMTNAETHDNIQKTFNLNDCSIVSLSNLGSISSVNINNCVYYTFNNNTISTCKIDCTNFDQNISAKSVIGFAKNSIQLLSAKNIANNFESNTINTAILEYPLYELHPPHRIVGNSISAFYFEYYDYYYLDLYLDKIYNNTIGSLYLPVENNYYQTINNGTYDLELFSSISNYFKSNNTISVIIPWFR